MTDDILRKTILFKNSFYKQKYKLLSHGFTESLCLIFETYVWSSKQHRFFCIIAHTIPNLRVPTTTAMMCFSKFEAMAGMLEAKSTLRLDAMGAYRAAMANVRVKACLKAVSWVTHRGEAVRIGYGGSLFRRRHKQFHGRLTSRELRTPGH